jgi:pimeloyl-ACP methyl ester carboxylesterase
MAVMTAPTFGCETARRRRLRVNGLGLSALEWGEPGRPGLLFLHGGSAHAHWFDAVVGDFVGRYHVLSLDQRGHGESDWPPAAPDGSAYATARFVDDLLGVMDALGWGRAALVGHSMGGHNAMALAAWHPERVWALTIADSRPSIPVDRLAMMHRRGHRGPRRHATLEAALASFRLLPRETVADPRLLAHLARQGIAERDGGFLYRFDPSANGTRQPVDAWELLPHIAAPTLLVRAGRSPILPPPMAEEILRRLPGARFEEIPDAYHHLVLDAPAAFARALRRFLDEVTPAQGAVPSARAGGSAG